MPTFEAKDGTQIFYKDWGTGPAVVFSHGWPLSADAWENQMLALTTQGFRCVAHDRRGHGRSGQPWQGNDMTTFADDLATLIEKLDLREIMLVGHSMGGGEVARYIGKYGTQRVAKIVLIAAVPPFLLKTAENPDGVDMKLFDAMREGITKDRAHFFEEMAKKFYGANKLMSGISQGVLQSFYMQAMQASIKSVFDCVQAFSETDFRADLRRFDVPTLFIHGDDDQLVPLQVSSERAAQLVQGSELLVYGGAPHGLCTTHHERISADLYDFASLQALSSV